MVIACPNCKRKYQIDTTRIPVGGTSFTCWSCRATVRVDPLGNTDASAPAPPTRPAIPGREPSLSAGETDPNVPPSAMRFFESLAAEATLTRQMAAENVETSAPEQPRRITGSFPPDALEQLQGDDVLDLPPIEPILDAPAPVGEVIDLELPAHAAQTQPVVTPAPAFFESAPESMHTVAFGSPTAEDLLEAAATADLPPPRPVPPPISLPPSISVPPPMAELPLPDFSTNETAQPHLPVQDEQEMLPTAPFSRPSGLEAPPGAPIPVEQQPFGPAESQTRMTAAEMAVNPQRAWVAPDVQAPEPRSRTGLLAIAAVVVVAVCLVAAWQFVLKDLIVGRPAGTATPVAPAPGSTPAPPTAPTDTASTATPTVPAPGTEPVKPPTPDAQAPAPVTSSAPAGASGGFTIQIRSSPNEADARQYADSLKAAGFDAYVMRADLGAKGIWYRVRVGRFQSREEAQREIGKLRSSARASEAIIQPFSEG